MKKTAKKPSKESETRILGLICGGGNLPIDVIKSLIKQNKKFFLLCLKDITDKNKIPQNLPQTWVRLGAGGSAIKALKKANVKDLIFAGSVSRPNWRMLFPDFYTIKVLLKHGFGKKSNDELFRALFKHVESEGFKILPVQDFVPDTVLKPGIYGVGKITKDTQETINFGAKCSYCIGLCDAGQTVIVQQGIALALEGEDGTDSTIKRAGLIKKQGDKPILVKFPKPGQEMRIDLPAVGTGTLNSIIQAGLQGVAILEDGAMIVDKEEVFAMCKKHRLFIYVMSHKEYDKIIKEMLKKTK